MYEGNSLPIGRMSGLVEENIPYELPATNPPLPALSRIVSHLCFILSAIIITSVSFLQCSEGR